MSRVGAPEHPNLALGGRRDHVSPRPLFEDEPQRRWSPPTAALDQSGNSQTQRNSRLRPRWSTETLSSRLLTPARHVYV
jgi:hypothetical protein